MKLQVAWKLFIVLCAVLTGNLVLAAQSVLDILKLLGVIAAQAGRLAELAPFYARNGVASALPPSEPAPEADTGEFTPA